MRKYIGTAVRLLLEGFVLKVQGTIALLKLETLVTNGFIDSVCRSTKCI